MFHVVFCILLLVIHMLAVADQLPRFGKRELICRLWFPCNYVVSVWRGFLFLLVLRMGLWHSHGLPYHNFVTLALVESSEVRVCRYSLCDVMLIAILYRTDPRNTA